MSQSSQVPILSSPFLTVGVVDTALDAETNPAVRVQLLGAKVHLLEKAREAAGGAAAPARAPTSYSGAVVAAPVAAADSEGEGDSTPDTAPSSRRPRPDPTALLSTRILLADAYLALLPPNLSAAEAESSVAEGECKRLMKVMKRLDRGDAGVEERPAWLDDIPRLRVRALRVLARVEDGLGRGARAERTRKLAADLEKR
ncbi:hypothetical protein CspHIS471_0312990 [Cutaneotrichosporon sp. HIS471]|nr:hypothetical protein CspHIS471_0312990 [Cutaneotrichosporon sp. HIS471]